MSNAKQSPAIEHEIVIDAAIQAQKSLHIWYPVTVKIQYIEVIMETIRTELTDVIYNATEQTFQARVTLYDADKRLSYACSVPGPITLPFDDAAKRLAKDALKRHEIQTGRRAAALQTTTLRSSLPEHRLRRGLPLGQYGFFRGRAA